jgi:hypothetical protein
VPGVVTFAEILEAELNCTNVPPPASHASSAWHRPLTPPLFVFDFPRPILHVSHDDLRNDAHARPRTQRPAAPFAEPPPSTPNTPLSARERRALMALNALGADVGDDLSVGTLRRAFRRLARRYHPDRHPGSSAAELERLARLFAEATEHYRVLAVALTARDRKSAVGQARS